VIVSYFVSLPALYRMVLERPSAHPEAFAWAASLTAILYFNFFWFREQLCLIVCPYGRLQSVLTDADTLVIGYDVTRGEPRGKPSQKTRGDCVDCGRCVVVCPTGIDIRNGLQIDCIGCARCIDACDDIMNKLGRAPGLVRYDSQNGFAKQRRQLFRPRVYLYAGLGLLGAVALGVALVRSEPFEANLLRMRGVPPFALDGASVRNAFEIHLVNKRSQPRSFELQGRATQGVRYVISTPKLSLPALADARVPVFVEYVRAMAPATRIAHIEVTSTGGDAQVLTAPLLGPD
jgi:cytochrome c oxidase accessory protein FixG